MSRQDDGAQARSGRDWSSRLWGGRKRWWLLGLPLGGMLALLAGAAAGFAFVGFVEYSSQDAMCLSCHEMRDYVYAEYQESAHFKTRSGVSPICSDCHVPSAWVPMMIRKVEATFRDIPAHFLGVIDTPEKFEQHRLRMAEAVWARLKASDSQECRGCHIPERMNLELQSRWARKKHSPEWRERTGDTCIDCHKGVAHHLPEIPENTRSQ